MKVSLHSMFYFVSKLAKKKKQLPKDGSRLNSCAVFWLSSSSCDTTWATACTVIAKMLYAIIVTGSAYMYRWVTMPWKSVNCCWNVSAPQVSIASTICRTVFTIRGPTFSYHSCRGNFVLGSVKHLAVKLRLRFKVQVLVASALTTYCSSHA